MKALRRGLLVAFLAVIASAVVKLLADRDHSAPIVAGPDGWRELDGPEFR